MARVVVLGGGFGGVVASESLARKLGPKHQVTLVSRHRDFTFFPALVRLAFGRCAPEHVFFDLPLAMRSRRVGFVRAEIARLDPERRRVLVTHGGIEVEMPYDYLVFALGRRLATECVPGFLEHAHHLLTPGAALKFGEAVKAFHRGHAVIGYCQDARLAVPVYEAAFALDRSLRARGERGRTRITIVTPERPGGSVGGTRVAPALLAALGEHGIEFLPDFPVNRVTAKEVWAGDGGRIGYDLLMLIPPFQGPGEAIDTGIADQNGYVRTDCWMRVTGADRMYAAGDAVNFPGPKMGHMAVLQGEVAAANVAAGIEGRELAAEYNHELMLVIDEGGKDSIYLHKKLWEGGEPDVRQGRFWGWAKRSHAGYWPRLHALERVKPAEE